MGHDVTCNYVIKGHGYNKRGELFETSLMGAMRIKDAIKLSKQTCETDKDVMYCSIWGQSRIGEDYVSRRGGDWIKFYPVTGKLIPQTIGN